MKLTDGKGIDLELTIKGYQFPDNTEANWDANWLMIEGRIVHPNGAWTFLQPCLTTFEVQNFAHWLQGIALKGDQIEEHFPDYCRFVEPCLIAGLFFSEGREVGIRCALECAPVWSSAGLWLYFPAAENDLAAAAGSLLVQLAQFPERKP